MDDVALAPVRHKLSVDDYHRRGEAGIFGDTERIELIDGELIDMAPIGHDHAGVVSGLNEALFLACAGRAIVWPRNPIVLDRSSGPRPDFAVLRRRTDFYRGALPGPADVLLLIEVSYSSLRYDRIVKLPLYARAGIADYGIVDLKRRVFDVYRSPGGDGYGDTATYAAGDQVALALAPDIVVRLDLVFG